MNIQVTKDEVMVHDIPQIHKGEYNVHELNFTYSSEYNNLVKTAIFEDGDNSIEVQIINNKCYIPNEILESSYDNFKLRVYGYEVTNKILKIRYSPKYTIIPKVEGSYKKDNCKGEEVTPTQFEQYSKALALGLKEIEATTKDLEEKAESGYFDGPPGPQGPQGPAGETPDMSNYYNKSETNNLLDLKENTSNKVTSISSSSTDTQYPSAKCVYDIVGDIGTALDTINGEVI